MTSDLFLTATFEYNFSASEFSAPNAAVGDLAITKVLGFFFATQARQGTPYSRHNSRFNQMHWVRPFFCRCRRQFISQFLYFDILFLFSGWRSGADPEFVLGWVVGHQRVGTKFNYTYLPVARVTATGLRGRTTTPYIAYLNVL